MSTPNAFMSTPWAYNSQTNLQMFLDQCTRWCSRRHPRCTRRCGTMQIFLECEYTRWCRRRHPRRCTRRCLRRCCLWWLQGCFECTRWCRRHHLRRRSRRRLRWRRLRWWWWWQGSWPQRWWQGSSPQRWWRMCFALLSRFALRLHEDAWYWWSCC